MIETNDAYIGPYVQPSYATTDRGRIRGHKFDRPLLEVGRGRRPIIMFCPISERVQIEGRLQIEVALLSVPAGNFRNDLERPHSIFRPLFCKPKSMKSYGTQFQATSNSTRSLIGLNITIGLRPRATSNRGRSISWPQIRPLSVVA